MNRALAYLLILLPASGCLLYSGDDDCEFGGGGGAEPIAPELLRNPDTGLCEDFGYGGGGGGGYCDDIPVAPSGAAEEADRAPAPDWGQCQSVCTGLDEGSCLVTPGCRGAYVGECLADAPCSPGDGNLVFAECWAVAPSGPVQGECGGLDAYECSRHDDCAAVHYPGDGGGTGTGGADAPSDALVLAVGPYQFCAREPNDDQPPGMHCYGEVACDALPPACPDGTTPGIYGACWSGECIPTDACPEGTCDEALCEIVPPSCPEGKVPGVADGCYTGYCIPADACEIDPRPCPELGESACIGRLDCAPYYQGVNCECTGDVCVCEDWLFESCQTI